MNKRTAAKRVYHAIENIDAELLYDARAYRAPKIKPYLRYAVAAVIVLMLLSTALIISAANTVKTYLTLDTNYGVTLELNGDNRVVKATSAASLYQQPAEACRKLNVGQAIAQLTDAMGERGGLDNHTNTLLFGVPEDTEIADGLIDAYDPQNYCVIRVAIDDSNSVQKLAEKRRVTMGKATLLQSVNNAENGVNENLLFRLSANDIALLLQSKQITADDFNVSGTPADGGYLGTKKAEKIALAAAGLSPESVECALESDGFKLIYVVYLYQGDKGAAVVLNAGDGEISRIIRGAATKLHKAIEKLREEYGTASENTPPQQITPITVDHDNPPTDSPATIAGQGTENTSPVINQPEPSTDKPLPTTVTPTDKSAVPTESPKIDTPTDADELPIVSQATEPLPPDETLPPPPEDDAYLIARGIWAADVQPTDIALGGNMVSEAYREDPNAASHNPTVVLITNRAQLTKYLESSDTVLDQFYRNRYMNDGWFDDHALIYATNTEYYKNTFCNNWFAFTRSGEMLYVAFEDNRERIERYDGDLYEIPNSVTYGIEINANLSKIKNVRIMKLQWSDAKNLIWLH